MTGADLYVSSLYPEERLLLSVVGGAQLGALAFDHVNWQRFETLVEQHAVSPLVYKRLSTYAQRVPENLLSALRRKAQLNLGFSLRLTKLLLELAEAFEANGVPTIPFKGPSLAVTAYNDLGLRPFSDLDIFIQKKDASKARLLLEQRGFKTPSAIPGKDLKQQVNYHDAFVNASDDLVELHWGIAPSFFIPALLDDFWGRAYYITVLGRPLRCFSPEDQLVLLTIHGGKHLWERLSWVCDVAMLLHQQPLSWSELLGRAQQLGSERMLLLGLKLAHELLGAPVPEPIVRHWQKIPELEKLTKDVGYRLFPSTGLATLSTPRFYYYLQARRSDRLRFIVYLLKSKLS